MIRRAEISACGSYRYRLTRHWDPDKRPLAFVMLNPSTADADLDDPTIRRCVGFAKRENAGGIVVVNLYALRATDPDQLRCVADPHGPKNADAILDVLDASAGSGDPIVCAWGTKPTAHRVSLFLSSAKGAGAKLVSLGVTKDGHPKHPLYVRADQPLSSFPAQLTTGSPLP